jgi:hypothetical protein
LREQAQPPPFLRRPETSYVYNWHILPDGQPRQWRYLARHSGSDIRGKSTAWTAINISDSPDASISSQYAVEWHHFVFE